MEKNETNETDTSSDGRSSDSIAPSPARGFYDTAGFATPPTPWAGGGDEPFDAENETTDAIDEDQTDRDTYPATADGPDRAPSDEDQTDRDTDPATADGPDRAPSDEEADAGGTTPTGQTDETGATTDSTEFEEEPEPSVSAGPSDPGSAGPTDGHNNPIEEPMTTATDTNAGFTQQAGAVPPPRMAANAPRRLYRTDGPISGVAAGLAEYFGIDEVLVRILLVAGSIVSFPVVPFAYIAAWMIIPKQDPSPVSPIMTTPAPPSPTDVTRQAADTLSGK